MQNKHTLDVCKEEEMVPKSNQNISSDFRELSSIQQTHPALCGLFYYLYFITKLTATVSISKMYNWLLPLFHFVVQLMQNIHAGVLHASKLSRDDGALLLIKKSLEVCKHTRYFNHSLCLCQKPQCDTVYEAESTFAMET